MRRRAGFLALLALLAGPGWAQQDEDAAAFVAFVREPAAPCVMRGGEQVLIKNTHASRTLQVWLDRFQEGVGTGDRSRSLLAPGGEPEPLGCSRNLTGAQEWRVARVRFAP